MKKIEETYMITPKGVIALHTNHEEATKIMEALELQALRMKCNALLIDSDGWEFIKVDKTK